ncbi:deoxyribonuclease [Candidatus Gracilibacteria bacterium]|nr:deoxyribonuclease [Candidatus Gracilibacteria bacterium]NUJ98796.1 deoxyribonuclease [Candidatus Gracilibacteria bacterium]
MTRVNLVPVKELYDQHLLAEHREIKRIPNLIKQGKYNFVGQPKKYTLGSGHVKFFYDKMEFLRLRYSELYDECLKRGFKVQNYGENFLGLAGEFYNNYFPDDEAIEISKARLKEKYKPNFYKYYGKDV